MLCVCLVVCKGRVFFFFFLSLSFSLSLSLSLASYRVRSVCLVLCRWREISSSGGGGGRSGVVTSGQHGNGCFVFFWPGFCSPEPIVLFPVSLLQLFFSYFKTLVGKEVVLELKNDLAIRGKLHSVDQFLNVKLDAIKVVDEERFPHLVCPKPALFPAGAFA